MPDQLDLSFKDFSLTGQAAKPKTFKIDADMFEAPAVIPGEVLGLLTEVGASMADVKGSPKQQMDQLLAKIADVMALLLPEDDAARFRDRLYSRTAPMDVHKQALPAMQWLIEAYGQRPTKPSSSSANGPEDDGGGLMATAPNEESVL